MKKTIIVLLSICFCAAMIFSLSACYGEKATQPDVPAPDNTVSDNNDTQTEYPLPNDASPVIHADITSDELLDRFDIIRTFGDDEIENYTLWCEADMTDFYIVGLSSDAENWTTDGVRLFEAAKISTNEAINYKRMVPEGFPIDAIVYTVNGETYMYAVSYNGRDGGISLIEIDRLTIAETNPTTTATTTAATTTASSDGFMVEAYWVSDDFHIFAREMTIESNSKWHVWKALKSLNKQIPSKCSLISGKTVKGKDGVMALDFSEEFKKIDSKLILQAIANTYIVTYNLDSVVFTVDGEYLENTFCGKAEEFVYTEV